MATRRRQRWIVGILLVATLAVLAVICSLTGPYIRAWIYDHRIRSGDRGDLRRQKANMWSLGHMKHPAAILYLEGFIDRPVYEGQAEEARLFLRRHFPQSWIGRGAKEYADIVGHPYDEWFHWALIEDGPRLPVEAEPRLRAWLERYRGHPGTDDALLLLAMQIEETEPMEALRTLDEAYDAPDRDKRQWMANWFQRVLERRTTPRQLEEWIAAGCPDHAREVALYCLGVKCMREHRFAEAVSLMERSAKERRGFLPKMIGWWPRYDPWPEGTVRADSFYAKIDAQLDACRWFAKQEAEIAATKTGERRAAVLHEMGRRCFHREEFVSPFYPNRYWDHGSVPLPEEVRGSSLSRCLESLPTWNRYRHAAAFFLRALEECPEYSQADAVAYSIPLCLWRWGRGSTSHASAIYEGFQAFADAYPQSSMADEALYAAGVHHWLASGEMDPNVIFANLSRIATEYPDGNIARQNRRQIEAWVYGVRAERSTEEPGAGASVESAAMDSIREPEEMNSTPF